MGTTLGAGLAVLGVILVGLTFGAPAASAAPWSCDAFGYLFQSPNYSTGNPDAEPHLVDRIDLATGASTTLPGGTPNTVNAVGYNPQDGFFYGWDLVTTNIVRIHSDLTMDQIPPPAGIPPGSISLIGDVDPQGRFWVIIGADYYAIDFDPGSPTYGQVVQSGPTSHPPGVVGGFDWGWIDGFLYRIGTDGAGEAHLVRFDPATGVQTDAYPDGLGFDNPGIGAVYADSQGYLYGSENGSGNIYRIDPATGQAILASDKGPQSSSNDGARCATAPVPTVTVTKTVNGRVRPSDQFQVSLVQPDGGTATSAATTGAATTTSTANWPVTQGATYTITDAMVLGSQTPLSEYTSSISCVDGAGNPVAVGGSGPSWTLTVGDTDHSCNVTNATRGADLEIEKSVSPSPVVAGAQGTYSLKVTNKGPATTSTVNVSDPLPDSVTFVSADPGCSANAGVVTCTGGELAVGQSQTFDVRVRFASSLDKCPSNTAAVGGNLADPDMSNNSSQICPPAERRAGLSITKTPSQPVVSPGGQVIYTLVVENHGPSDATDVTVVDPMAPGLTLTSARASQGSCSTTDGKLSCSLGNLARDGAAQILVTAGVGNTPGEIRNVATVSGAERETERADNHDEALTTVAGGADPRFDLAVTKTANRKAVPAGGTVRYSITVRNNGPDTAPGVKVTDTFNRGASLVSVSSSSGSCSTELPISCSVGDIASGATVTITVVLRSREADCKQRNAASATGEGIDANARSNLSRVDLCVRPKLRVVKTVDRKRVRGGGLLRYTIRTTNRSRAVTARNVRICDKLPSGLVFVRSSAKAKLSKGRYCWTAARLAARKSVRYRLSVRALAATDGRKRNVATAAGPDGRQVRGRAVAEVLGRQVPVPMPTG